MSCEKRTIPNTDEVGIDVASTPVVLKVPLRLIEDQLDALQWIIEPMDQSTASQLAAIAGPGGVLAQVISLDLILPSAGSIAASGVEIDHLVAEPLRVMLSEL